MFDPGVLKNISLRKLSLEVYVLVVVNLKSKTIVLFKNDMKCTYDITEKLLVPVTIMYFIMLCCVGFFISRFHLSFS